MRLAANPSSLCAAVWLELLLLCPVAVCIRLKSLLSSGLSSPELAPSAIPIERATPQSGASNCSQCGEGQCTMGRRGRTCVRCARSCAMQVQISRNLE